MAAPISPVKKMSNGRDHWWLVPTVADKYAPTVGEINATTGLNITGVLLSDYEGSSSETEKVTLPKVMLETTSTQVNGETTHNLADMQMTFHPQAAANADGKKAWELFEGGTFTGYVVRRQDVSAPTSDAVTAGQFVDVYPVQSIRNAPTRTSNGPDGVYVFTVSHGVTGEPAFNVAVQAGA